MVSNRRISSSAPTSGTVVDPTEVCRQPVGCPAFAQKSASFLAIHLSKSATAEEIMEVLKLCVVQGVQACNLGVPILAQELARAGRAE